MFNLQVDEAVDECANKLRGCRGFSIRSTVCYGQCTALFRTPQSAHH